MKIRDDEDDGSEARRLILLYSLICIKTPILCTAGYKAACWGRSSTRDCNRNVSWSSVTGWVTHQHRRESCTTTPAGMARYSIFPKLTFFNFHIFSGHWHFCLKYNIASNSISLKFYPLFLPIFPHPFAAQMSGYGANRPTLCFISESDILFRLDCWRP